LNRVRNSRSELLKEIQDLGLLDAAWMLPLNNAHAHETSLLDESSMAALLSNAFYRRGVDRGATALLIALDQNAPYDNPNFSWFKQRYDSFVYIDRIIVANTARGQGIARRLYLDLFAKALQAGHHRVVCEINIEPPNPASDAFHAAMGFVAVGQAILRNQMKTVGYFEKMLR
jgi:predicted GNAT superfamily acetyltransferase